VLLKAATQLKQLQDRFETATEEEIEETLVYNRKLWTIFATAVSDENSPLPKPIRQNIASLAVFIFKHTLDISIYPEARKLNVLININREIASGLRGIAPENDELANAG